MTSKELFKRREVLQYREMLSSKNKWFTGENKKHPPTDEECAFNYIEKGGAEAFAKKWPRMLKRWRHFCLFKMVHIYWQISTLPFTRFLKIFKRLAA